MANFLLLYLVAGCSALPSVIKRVLIIKNRLSSIINIITIVFIITIYVQSIGPGLYDDSWLIQATNYVLIQSLAIVPIKNKNKNKNKQIICKIFARIQNRRYQVLFCIIF